jgi:hypothetical protein
MSIKKTLGGDRLGSGKKMTVSYKNYERSTHDLSYIWRSTMATGTLVPFLKQVALPGDTFDIDLNADVKTLPTVGPLFGSFKLQLDVFMIPMRLYNAQLHMNKLNVGMDMSKVKFPFISISTNKINPNDILPIELQQINPSSLVSYLGFKGTGINYSDSDTYVSRSINAMPILAYYDIYKNYYSNKMEEVGYVISPDFTQGISLVKRNGSTITLPNQTGFQITTGTYLDITVSEDVGINDIELEIDQGNKGWVKIKDVFNDVWKDTSNIIHCYNVKNEYKDESFNDIKSVSDVKNIKLLSFPLSNIDTMREYILKASSSSAFNLTSNPIFPYYNINNYVSSTMESFSKWSMNGLALKTYQSDIFNNWLKNELVSGTNGTSINEITAISTSSGSFTIDSLNLAKKVYDMLNRIAVSGGSYEDWLQAVYTHDVYRRAESPIYMGGLSKEIVFQEVIANSGFETNGNSEALGTLAGRGVLSQKHKGGKLYIKVDEPSYIMGIISITPRIDYSQGEDWDLDLKTMNDLHKPALDGIGFQDLITSQMAFWEIHRNSNGDYVKYSAGKQPAWINYMTNFNKTFGNFANPNDQMFMTLNRRYEFDPTTKRIKDLTTYIDPKKFNYIFADTERDAQNFWVQVAVDCIARRKMSAKIIPNL